MPSSACTTTYAISKAAAFSLTQSLRALLAGRGVRVHAVLTFFFNDTATTEIYTLSLHDALPIYARLHVAAAAARADVRAGAAAGRGERRALDRKSTRLNSSHMSISYAVFCL